MTTKRILTNVLLIVFPVLVLVFLSQPYINALTGISVIDRIQNGYEMVRSANADALVCNAVCIVITSISACALLLLSIFGLLRGLNVIRFEKLDKAVVWLKMLSVMLLFLGATISFICIAYQCGHKGALDLFNYTVGWGVIVNFVVGCLVVTTYLVERISIKPKKKAKTK